MRRARRTDGNQAEIVRVLRQVGCSVEVLSDVGRGVPDPLVARAGVNYLIEVKMPGETLNALEATWHRGWRGPVHVITSVDAALAAVGVVSRLSEFGAGGVGRRGALPRRGRPPVG